MKMIEFVHDHGPRWIIAIVRELSILYLKGSWILCFLFGLICILFLYDRRRKSEVSTFTFVSKSLEAVLFKKDNLSEWIDMSICGLLFQWASTIKIKLSMLV